MAIDDAIGKAEMISRKLDPPAAQRESCMKAVITVARRFTRFLLASFLWFHAVFFWTPHTRILAGLSRYLHLTLSEVTLFVLLLLFTILWSSGWWSSFKSALYIYGFPFVLLWYFVGLVFLMFKGINAWFSRDQPVESGPSFKDLLVLPQSDPASAPQQAIAAQAANSGASGVPAVPIVTAAKKKPTAFSIVTQPFRRFTVLWCALLLLATHNIALWLSFAVVLCLLGLRTLTILKLTLFSRSWLEKIGAGLYTRLNVMIGMLAAVTPKTQITKELKDLWQQLGLLQRVARFLGNRYLLSRWASLMVGAFYVCIYVYMALLFSFVYFGLGRVSGVNLPWSEAAVDSIFIPVYVSELPKTFFIRLAGGVQWTLIVIVGFGTFWNYFHRRLDAVNAAAIEITGILADERVRTKYNVLSSIVKSTKVVATARMLAQVPSPTSDPTPGKSKAKRRRSESRRKR